jgi:hypothetical protein
MNRRARVVNSAPTLLPDMGKRFDLLSSISRDTSREYLLCW